VQSPSPGRIDSNSLQAAWSVCVERVRVSRFRSISGSSTKPQLMHRITADSGK
jgi:hypothetical protein